MLFVATAIPEFVGLLLALPLAREDEILALLRRMVDVMEELVKFM